MALTLCDHCELFLHTLSCHLAESTMKKFCQGTLRNKDLIDHPHIGYSLRHAVIMEKRGSAYDESLIGFCRGHCTILDCAPVCCSSKLENCNCSNHICL